MASAGTVTVDFAAETAKFTAELKKVNDRLRGLENGFNTVASAARIAFGALSVGALTAFVKSSAEAADELGKTADKLNMSTTAVKAFQIAAVEAGVGLEQSNKLLTESQKRLGEAATGTGEAAKYIELLGLNVRDLQQLAPDQLFRTYAESINGLANRSEQLAAANALMGKSAQEAFSLLQAGAPALDEAAQFTERFGLALDRVSIKQIEAANDALGRITIVSQAAGQRIAAGLAPAVEFFATKLLDATGNTEGLQGAMEQLGAVAITAFEVISNAAHSLEAAFFGVAAGGAGILQTLTFGGVSEAFAASVDANLVKANDALGKIKSIEQIQQTIVQTMEESRRRAEESVAAQAGQDAAARAGGVSISGESVAGLNQEQQLDIQTQAASAAAAAQKQIQRDITRETEAELERRSRAAQYWRDFEMASNLNAAQSEMSLRQQATNAALNGVSLLAARSKTWAKIQKGIQIAQAIRDTYVGITHQLTSGDPYTAVARAAAVGAFGFLQVAQIQSTPDQSSGASRGIAGDSGVSIGATTNPVFSQEDDGNQASSRAATQIVFAGPVFNSEETRRFIVDAIREETDRDVVVISPTSRNGQELRGG